MFNVLGILRPRLHKPILESHILNNSAFRNLLRPARHPVQVLLVGKKQLKGCVFLVLLLFLL